MLSMPQEERKKRMDQLQIQDPVLLACVKAQMSDLESGRRQNGAQGGGGGASVTPISPQYSGGSSSSTPMRGN